MICENVSISYLSHFFLFDFYVLDFKGFDFILRLDWLSKFQAKIKCAEEMVTLITRIGSEAKIPCGKPDIHTCSFLYALKTSQESLETLEVVRDFSDVFDEVKSLPTHREIEFRIYLIPGARPVDSTQKTNGSEGSNGAGKANARSAESGFD